MSVSREKIIETKQWLSSRHAVVPLEWVEACVSFLVQEYKDPFMPLQTLKNHVYQQWLVADFSEIGVSTLPLNLPTCQKMSLTGVYALQVNGIRDVGRPAYAQLRQLEGMTNADAEVSAAPKAAVPEWEAKPTRMLMLNLTDGVSFVQGMEYKPITSLSPNLPPGVKVLIKGPMECRLGLLLLTANNIEILGGEVDKYQSVYSREEMLRDALQLNSAQGECPRASTNSAVQHQQQPPLQNDNNDIIDRSSFPDMPFDRPVAHDSIQTFAARPNCSSIPKVPDNFDDDDDFMQDLDYNALDEIERANSQQSSPNVSEVQKSNMNSHCSQHLQHSPDINSQIKKSSDGGLCNEFSNKSSSSKDVITTLETLPKVEYIKKEFTVTIKGSVNKVLSKLECKATDGWHLIARVNDETSHIDVEFHDKVLEVFVGVSAKNMMAMQTESRRNEKIKEQISKAISGFKKKLQKLNCLMKVKFCPGEKPCVIECLEE